MGWNQRHCDRVGTGHERRDQKLAKPEYRANQLEAAEFVGQISLYRGFTLNS